MNSKQRRKKERNNKRLRWQGNIVTHEDKYFVELLHMVAYRLNIVGSMPKNPMSYRHIAWRFEYYDISQRRYR